MKTKLRKLIWLTGSLMITGTLCAQEKFNLEFSYKPGETYRYRSSYNYDMSQEMNGQEMKMSGSSYSILKLVVESVSAGGDMTFINSYEEMKSSMKNTMMDTTIVQKDIIGKRGKVVIDKFGKEISKEIIDTVKSEKGMGPGSVASIYSVNFVKLPGHPVAIGEKWTFSQTDTTKIGDGYTVTTSDNEYTLLQKEMKDGHECFNIAIVSKSETTGKLMQMGMEMFLEGSAESKGAAWVDPKLGILVARESESTQEITYALTGQMKMSIPSTQSIKTSYKLVE